jgi:hypothetical protein
MIVCEQRWRKKGDAGCRSCKRPVEKKRYDGRDADLELAIWRESQPANRPTFRCLLGTRRPCLHLGLAGSPGLLGTSYSSLFSHFRRRTLHQRSISGRSTTDRLVTVLLILPTTYNCILSGCLDNILRVRGIEKATSTELCL